jgi:hypothetical protein
VTNYPNDPNQPGGYGEQPKDGSGDGAGDASGNKPQYGSPQYGYPGYNSPQYGAPQAGPPYGAPQDGSPYGAPQNGSQYGAQPYGAPQYGAPQYGGDPYGAPMQKDHDRATLIMVLGILSIVCCGLFTGIPAIIMGRQATQQIDASGGALGGRGKVQAGFICGIIGTVLSVLGIVVRLTAG